MRRAANVDRNQGYIADLARRLGASVAYIHSVGGGVPDLLLGYAGENILVEVKNPEARGKLNENQKKFHAGWRGTVVVIESGDQLVSLLAHLRQATRRKGSYLLGGSPGSQRKFQTRTEGEKRMSDSYSGKKVKPCRFCSVPLIWIETAKTGKHCPVEVPPVVRNGSEPPLEAKYFDIKGNFYHAHNVPMKTEVFVSHWGNCPGAEKARRR